VFDELLRGLEDVLERGWSLPSTHFQAVVTFDTRSVTQDGAVATLVAGGTVAKSHKVQVTLDEDQYTRLVEVARRQDKKLAAVVRESIVRYCVEPEVTRRKQDALDRLLALDPTPVPHEYSDWEKEYARRAGAADGDEPAGDDPAAAD
jgi:hypothetical protein